VRKRYLLTAAVGLLALAIASVAIASPQLKQTVSAKYSTKKAKKAAGVTIKLNLSDPGAQPPGNLPSVQKVTLKLKGAKVNSKAAKRCTLPKSQAVNCPSNTQVSTGGASKNAATANIVGTNPTTGQTTVTGPINNTVTAYNKSGGLFLVIKGTSLPTVVVLDTKLSKKGTLVANPGRDVPNLPGGNKIVLVSLKTKVKKKTKKSHGKTISLLTTPKCGKSKKFKVTSKFEFSDGTVLKPSATQKCRR
jgi:hypothetical protein